MDRLKERYTYKLIDLLISFNVQGELIYTLKPEKKHGTRELWN